MEGIGKFALIVLLGAILLACLGGCAVVGIYNGLVGADIGVQTKWADVQVMYQRRLDLSNQIVKAVNAGSDKELQAVKLLTDQAAALASAFKKDPSGKLLAPTTDAEAKAITDATTAFNGASATFLAFASANPQWQSVSLYKDYVTITEGSENRIAVARRDYNAAVAQYWSATRYFPGSIIAGMFGFYPTRYAQFAADEGASKAPDPALK